MGLIRNQQVWGSNPHAGSIISRGYLVRLSPFMFWATIRATIRTRIATQIFSQVGATTRATNLGTLAPEPIP
jgi:hypothetical protein